MERIQCFAPDIRNACVEPLSELATRPELKRNRLFTLAWCSLLTCDEAWSQTTIEGVKSAGVYMDEQ